MDVRTPVHSRHSQFNKRVPKSGPTPSVRFMEPPPKAVLDNFSKSKKSSPASYSLLLPRPIATNSRVKQDEKYRRDMYLAFVNNALQQKANVSPHISQIIQMLMFNLDRVTVRHTMN